jgi:hypothetical protein
VVALGSDSDLVSGLMFGFEIGGAGRIIADLNCGEERLSSMFFQLLDLLGDLFLDLSGNQFAIHEYCRQFLKRTLLPSNLK